MIQYSNDNYDSYELTNSNDPFTALMNLPPTTKTNTYDVPSTIEITECDLKLLKAN